MRIKTYSELRRIENFKERFDYLKLSGVVGADTFGFDRYLNQEFYRSSLWKRARRDVIARDLGCNLGAEGYEIFDRVYVHHMNPMRVEDITHYNEDIINPEFLICVDLNTHNAIHYGDERLLPRGPIQRRAGDTKLW